MSLNGNNFTDFVCNRFFWGGVLSLILVVLFSIKKKQQLKKICLKALIVCGITYGVGFIGLIIYSKVDDSRKEAEREIEWQNKWTSAEQAKKSIENTDWHYCYPVGDDDNYRSWCRLKFRNGKLYFYEARPSEGEWGSPSECEYVVEEGRYSNTDEKYVVLKWESGFMKYAFIPKEKELLIQTRDGYEHARYLYEGDEESPWYDK